MEVFETFAKSLGKDLTEEEFLNVMSQADCLRGHLMELAPGMNDRERWIVAFLSGYRYYKTRNLKEKV